MSVCVSSLVSVMVWKIYGVVVVIDKISRMLEVKEVVPCNVYIDEGAYHLI